MSVPTVMVVLGTRPEAIKLAPVIKELERRPERFRMVVCSTGQHREMLDPALKTFDITPDIELSLMQPDQTLAGLTARVLEAMHGVYADRAPDAVLVQGDTTTVMAGALCAFYHQIPVGHVEAGLRTDDPFHPFPEEINRRLASQVADWHFAPTEGARQNLLDDGVRTERIFVTGNTAVDAVLMAREMARERDVDWHGITDRDLGARRVVLITGHRRENFGAGFEAICRAIRRLAERLPNVAFIYPVHLNPNVRRQVFDALRGVINIHLIEPLDYLPFVALMERSSVILTDSGGLQEEAPSLGKPVLVMREKTERPEGLEAGTMLLVGSDADRIVAEVEHLLTDPAAYEAMSRAPNPFGDGTAARQIVDILDKQI